MLNILTDFFLGSVAHAQTAQGGAQANPFQSFLPLIIIFAIFYFLMIRPQKKRLDEEQKVLAALQKGDEVYTKSGVLGTITGLTEKVVTLEVSEGVKMKFLRSYIGGSTQKIFGSQANNPDTTPVSSK